MPRPRKCRKVCCLPDNDGFVPVRGGEELTPIMQLPAKNPSEARKTERKKYYENRSHL